MKKNSASPNLVDHRLEMKCFKNTSHIREQIIPRRKASWGEPGLFDSPEVRAPLRIAAKEVETLERKDQSSILEQHDDCIMIGKA